MTSAALAARWEAAAELVSAVAWFPPTRVGRRWRLIPFLLLAGLAHVLAIIILPAPRFDRLAPLPALEVRLAPQSQLQLPEDTRISLPKPGMAPEIAKTRRNQYRIPPSVLLASPLEQGKEQAASIPMRPAPSSVPPQISVETLLGSARDIARDEARRTAPANTRRAGDEDSPVLPGLAKALKREAAGERKFSDGLFKVVTPSGTVYCMKPLPDTLANSGPVKPTIVPTTCP